MIRIRLSTGDINGFLQSVPDAELAWHNGAVRLTKTVAKMRLHVTAHLDLHDGHVRVVLPFNEMRTDHTGRLVGGMTSLIWPRWLEPWLERLIADKLSAAGLPWDLVWVDTVDDPERGRLGTVNLSPRTLNEWLRRQDFLGAAALRLVGIDVVPDALTLVCRLAERHEIAPVWRAGDGEGEGS